MEQMSLFDGNQKNAKHKNPIFLAKENLAYFSVDEVELTDLFTVLIGNQPEIIGRLAAIDLRELSIMSKAELMEVGMKESVAIKLMAVFGISKKLAETKSNELVTVRTPKNVADVLMEEMRYLKQEHFVCLFLNTKNQIEGKKTVSIGTLNSSLVHPREVFKEAVKRSTSAIIVVHNHPSGDPTPSREDIEVTKRLIKSGDIMGIDLLDHIVIGDGKYVSLKERGLI